MKKMLLTAALLAGSLSILSAKVTLPSLVGDNMVLQRNTEVNVWGKADPGATVTVRTSWDNAKYRTSADSDGNWLTKVRTADAGGPYTVTISDGESLTLNGVMLGEVWFCSGQSNMEMPVRGFVGQPVEGSAETIRECYAHPNIRMFFIARQSSETPQEDCEGEWLLPTPENVGNCSAAAYYFGRELSDILGIPVGLITSHWGGTMIETWMPCESILAIDGIDRSVFQEVPEGEAPGRLYNGMVCPALNYVVNGVIWYQGESNRYHPFDYSKLMSSMILSWRAAWGRDDLPFICTQLVHYRYDGKEYLALPVLIEQQYIAAANTPHTYIAPTTDILSPGIIHPARKRDCGERMADIALKHCYGIKGLTDESPKYSGMEIDGNQVTLRFTGMAESESGSETGDSFSWLDKNLNVINIKGFEVAGEDRKFYPAKAHLGWPVADRITVQSDSVQTPVAVRYAFRNYIEANVMTISGTPLAPFRTDDWEITDEMLRKEN